MSIKKLSRVVIAAFVLTLVLAVSSFAAYSFTLEGTVAGLEDGVSYTAAKYDFANNTYGEFTELTEDTVLTSGIWGIKAGDAEPEALFVQSANSGKFNFWNAEKDVAANVFKGGTLTDSYVPGFWSAKKGTAFPHVTYYDGYPSLCVHLEKKAFLTQAEVAKTVTVGEFAYPLYTIDGAEYYLKEDAYYAVADNALYEGEGEAVAVTTLTWTGATAVEGEANLLAESEYFYGFTNEQVVPASAVLGYTSGTMAMVVGCVKYNTGYSAEDLGSEMVFYTKTIGSDVVTEYTAETTTPGKFTVATPEIPADAYIVGVGFRPYAGAPDDIFVNNASNSEARGYYHQWMSKSNDVGLTLETVDFPAPEGITGGNGEVLGLEEGKRYEIALVTLNSTGDGYAIGEWTELNAETNKDLAGLAVVRLTNADGSIVSLPTEMFYITGDMAARATLSVMGDNGKIIASSGNAFVVGEWKGSSCGVYEQATGAFAVLDQTVGGQTDSQNLWLYQNTKESAQALLDLHAANDNYAESWKGGKKPEIMQKEINDFYAAAAEKDADTLAAEKAALQAKIAGIMESRNFKYAFTSEQIIPAEEMLSFELSLRKRQGSYILDASATIIFKVLDLEGNITEYTWTSPVQTYKDGASSWLKIPVNAALVLPDEGYVVGVEVHPVGDIDVSSIKSGDGTFLAAGSISARFIQNQWQAGFFYDTYEIADPRYPKLKGLVGGFGVIGGLEKDGVYQYSLLTLSADGTSLIRGEWNDLTDEIPCGLMSIREVMEGGVTAPSDMIYVYGSAVDRADLCEIDPATNKLYVKDGTGFVPNYWTGKSAATHSTFATYVVSTTGGGWVMTGDIKDVKTAEAELAALKAAETPDEAAIAAAEANVRAKRQVFVDKSTNNWIYYGFGSDKIVKISELKSFAFKTKVRQGITYNAAYESKIAVYISDANGIITRYEIVTPAAMDGTERVIDFTNKAAWTPALPEDGFVVGLAVDQWYGKTDINAWQTPNTYNTMPEFTFLPEEYIIETLTLPEADAPEGLYVEDGVIKGLDADIKYQYAATGLSGTGDWFNIPEESTEYAPAKSGLYAIRVVGNGITNTNSPSTVVLVPGDGRASIIHTTKKVGTGGKYKDIEVDILDQKNASYTAENRETPVFNEKLWTGMTIEPVLCLHYGYDPLNMGGTSCPISSAAYCTALQALEALQAEENPDAVKLAEAQAKYDEAEANLINLIEEIWFSYQYAPDEVIPMADFVRMTFKPFVRQLSANLASGKFQSKFVFKVMLEDGTIVDRVVYKDSKFVQGSGNGADVTVELSDFEETDGYIVGIVIYPYGRAVDAKMKGYLVDRKVAGDIDLTLYADKYIVKAPAPAPEFEIVADIDGIGVEVENAIEGATYAWSIDGNTWTNAPEGASIFTIIGATDVVYVKMLAYDAFFESSVTEKAVPTFKDVPTLTLGEGNVLTVEAGLYEIAKLAFNTEVVYEPLTEKTLTTGVWAVRAIGDETAATSAPQIIYVAGDAVGTINYTVKNGKEFAEGKWAVPSFSTMYKTGATWDVAIAEIHGSAPYKLDQRRAFALRYQFTADEIISVKAIADISSDAPAFYHGYIRDGFTKADGNGARAVSTHGQTMARVYVVGAKVPYYDIYTEIKYEDGYKFAISEYLADKEGYVVALELYPLWSIYGADNKTDLGDDCTTALWLTSLATPNWSDYTYKLRFINQLVENELPEGETLPTTNSWGNCCYADGTNRFAISIEKAIPATPELILGAKSAITISNYSAIYAYEYSSDGGETWETVPGKSFNATKASTEYLVKIVESGSSFASETASIVSSPVVVVGSSLVLDGQIGVKMYFDIDEDTIPINLVTFHATKYNSDYAGVADMGSVYKEYGYTDMAKSTKDWLGLLSYDEAQDLYYVIFYVPAKDADNSTIQTELVYYLNDGTKVSYGSVDNSFKVTSYIAEAKALAEAGDATFVEALPVVEALENYLTYADAYFLNKTVDVYKTDATISAEAATRTNATLEGVEFYGTSLILEDNVTIRHYFKVNDIDAFVAAGYTCDIDFGTKGDYIYYDITDIAAQNLGTQYALTIKNSEGVAVYEVKYAATNYIAAMANDSNANLASLVNAMYDYYLAAADYAK